VTPHETAAETLGREAARQQLSPELVPAALNAVIDWSAVTLGASRNASVVGIGDRLGTDGGPARLIGRSRRADPSVAALVNGTAAHTLELDDIYAPGTFHPGAPVIAAALAVSDLTDCSGADLLRAIMIGYEVGGRVSADLGPAHYRNWHTTGTAGAPAAAAAAGILLGADGTQLAHAISLGATMAAGLQQTFRSDAQGKPLHAGHAAQAGVVAAVAACAGMTGARDALEGPAGLGVATGASETSWRWSRSAWGTDRVIEQITVKTYPCCGHTFAAIDSALAVRGALGGRVYDFADIEVVTYAAAVDVAGIRRPKTPAEARFSIPFAVTAALFDGAVTSGSFDAVADVGPARVAVTDRVRLRARADYDAAFPDRRGAEIVVTGPDGTVHRAVTPDRLGAPRNPVPPGRIEAKYLEHAGAVLGRDAAERGLAQLRQLYETPDMGSVTAW
jgi:2-methylcitrate dehydratase PrpD